MIRLALLALLLGGTNAFADGVLQVDPAHSEACFTVRLFWVRPVRGCFDAMQGQVNVGAGGQARAQLRFEAEQVRMEVPRYAELLRSEAFFDTVHYPDISFSSAPFPVRMLNHGGRIGGRLSLRGDTRQVLLDLTPSACDPAHQHACSIRVRGQIHRSDFGMTAHRMTLADVVALDLTIQLPATEFAGSVTP